MSENSSKNTQAKACPWLRLCCFYRVFRKTSPGAQLNCNTAKGDSELKDDSEGRRSSRKYNGDSTRSTKTRRILDASSGIKSTHSDTTQRRRQRTTREAKAQQFVREALFDSFASVEQEMLISRPLKPKKHRHC